METNYFSGASFGRNLKSKKAEQRMVRASVLQAVSPEFPYCHTQAAIAGKRTAQGILQTPPFLLWSSRNFWDTFRRNWCFNSSMGSTYSSFGR